MSAAELGHGFLQPEPLWEKFRGWSVYQYGMNNPLRLSDGSGLGPGDGIAESTPRHTSEFGTGGGKKTVYLDFEEVPSGLRLRIDGLEQWMEGIALAEWLLIGSMGWLGWIVGIDSPTELMMFALFCSGRVEEVVLSARFVEELMKESKGVVKQGWQRWSAYDSERFGNAFGYFSAYFDKEGRLVRVEDVYDFNPVSMKKGQKSRSLLNEIKTRIVRFLEKQGIIRGKAYKIRGWR